MKRTVFNIIFVLALFASFSYLLAITTTAEPQTEQVNTADLTAFKHSMKKAIDDQKTRIQTLKNVVFDLKAPVQPGAGDKLVKETVILEVKEALYKNFIDSPVSQDPQFQTKLLRVMNQSDITENDLKDLQKAADDANARVHK